MIIAKYKMNKTLASDQSNFIYKISSHFLFLEFFFAMFQNYFDNLLIFSSHHSFSFIKCKLQTFTQVI